MDWWSEKSNRSTSGSQVAIIPAQLIEHQSEEALNIKIVYDKIAPAYRVVDPDIPYPYRQKELIDEVNKNYLRELV